MADRTISELAAAVEDVLRTTLDLAREIGEDEADRPTDCPGWTVRDQLSHMVGLEQVLNGAPFPTVELPGFDHVLTDFDVYMEKIVHIRRQLPLSSIADELAGLLPRRVAQLRALAAEGDPMVLGPFGERALSASMPIRVFDLWAHEQDIRRAIGLPVRQTGVAAEVALERTLLGWSGLLPKQVEGVDGVLSIRVTGRPSSDASITLGNGGPTATLIGDVGRLTWLGCGRGAADPAWLEGDPTVIAAVMPHLGFTP